MLIELNVYWWPDDYDYEEDKALRKKPKLTKGKLVISSNHIVAYNPHDEGGTMIRLTNGENFHTTYPYDKFNDLMMSEQVTNDMLVSKHN